MKGPGCLGRTEGENEEGMFTVMKASSWSAWISAWKHRVKREFRSKD